MVKGGEFTSGLTYAELNANGIKVGKSSPSKNNLIFETQAKPRITASGLYFAASSGSAKAISSLDGGSLKIEAGASVDTFGRMKPELSAGINIDVFALIRSRR